MEHLMANYIFEAPEQRDVLIFLGIMAVVLFLTRG